MNAQILLFLQETLFVIIAVAIHLVTKNVISYLSAQKAKIVNDTSNKDDLFYRILDIVGMCVNATAQLYVDDFKRDGSFDIQAQKTAFLAAKDFALSLLNDEMKKFIIDEYNDLDKFLEVTIENKVKNRENYLISN